MEVNEERFRYTRACGTSYPGFTAYWSHNPCVTEPFSGSSERESRAPEQHDEIYISTREWALAYYRNFRSFLLLLLLSFSLSFILSLSSTIAVCLIIIVMPRGVKVYTTRPLVDDLLALNSLRRCFSLSRTVRNKWNVTRNIRLWLWHRN